MFECSNDKPVKPKDCELFFRQQSVSEIIRKSKNNMYSKDTWQDQVIIDRVTGIHYKLGEIDKLINN